MGKYLRMRIGFWIDGGALKQLSGFAPFCKDFHYSPRSPQLSSARCASSFYTSSPNLIKMVFRVNDQEKAVGDHDEHSRTTQSDNGLSHAAGHGAATDQ